MLILYTRSAFAQDLPRFVNFLAQQMPLGDCLLTNHVDQSLILRSSFSSVSEVSEKILSVAASSGLPTSGDLSGWYNFRDKNALSLRKWLRRRKTTLPEALLAAFPRHDWQPWRFRVSSSYWKSESNSRNAIRDVIIERGGDPDDFQAYYSLSRRILSRRLGKGILLREGTPASGLTELFRSLFPEHEWHPWKFHSTPVGYWLSEENRISFLKYVGKSLQLFSPDDWYRVSRNDFESLGGMVSNRSQTPRLAHPSFQALLFLIDTRRAVS